MNDPLELLELMTEKAREIPELVALAGGDPQRIEFWKPRYPDQSSVLKALASQPNGSVRFIYERTRPQNGNGLWWRHEYVVQFHPDDETGEQWGGMVRMSRALINGRTEDGRPWMLQCFRPGTDSVDGFELAPRLLSLGGVAVEMWLGRFFIGDKEP